MTAPGPGPSVDLSDVADARRALGRLAREIPGETGDRIMADVAAIIDARLDGAVHQSPAPQAGLIAGKVAAVIDGSDIVVGGAMSAPAGRGTVGDLIFGVEYGSNAFRQFHASRNPGGYGINPTVSELLTGGDVDRVVMQDLDREVRATGRQSGVEVR